MTACCVTFDKAALNGQLEKLEHSHETIKGQEDKSDDPSRGLGAPPPKPEQGTGWERHLDDQHGTDGRAFGDSGSEEGKKDNMAGVDNGSSKQSTLMVENNAGVGKVLGVVSLANVVGRFRPPTVGLSNATHKPGFWKKATSQGTSLAAILTFARFALFTAWLAIVQGAVYNGGNVHDDGHSEYPVEQYTKVLCQGQSLEGQPLEIGILNRTYSRLKDYVVSNLCATIARLRTVQKSYPLRKLVVTPSLPLILVALSGAAAATDPSSADEYLGVDRNLISDALSYFWDLVGSAAVIATFLAGSVILFTIIFCTKPRKGSPTKTAFVAGMASVCWWLMEILDTRDEDESQKIVAGWISALLWAIFLSLCAKGLDESDQFLFETMCSGGLTVMGIIFLIVAIRILEKDPLDRIALRIALSFFLPPLNAWTWFQYKRHVLRETMKGGVVHLLTLHPPPSDGTSTALEAHGVRVRNGLSLPAGIQRPPSAISRG